MKSPSVALLSEGPTPWLSRRTPSKWLVAAVLWPAGLYHSSQEFQGAAQWPCALLRRLKQTISVSS